MECAGHDPHLLWPYGSIVNLFCVPAGKSDIVCITYQQHREAPGRNRLLWRYLGSRKPGERFAAVDHRPGSRGEPSFSQPRIAPEPGVVIGRLANVGKPRFGDPRLDARLDGSRLQRNACSHRLSQSKQVLGMLTGFDGIDDGAVVVSL